MRRVGRPHRGPRNLRDADGLRDADRLTRHEELRPFGYTKPQVHPRGLLREQLELGRDPIGQEHSRNVGAGRTTRGHHLDRERHGADRVGVERQRQGRAAIALHRGLLRPLPNARPGRGTRHRHDELQVALGVAPYLRGQRGQGGCGRAQKARHRVATAAHHGKHREADGDGEPAGGVRSFDRVGRRG